MKKFFTIAVVAVMLFALAGCRGAPLPIDFDAVVEAARDAGFAYNVNEAGNFVRVEINEHAFVEFTEAESMQAARAMFDAQEADYNGRFSSFTMSRKVNMPLHGSWRFRSGGGYYVIYWVGHGFLRAEGRDNATDRNAIDGFLDTIIRRA